jgi:predicted dehydrogenase
LAGWRADYPAVRCFTRYEELLASQTAEAVLLATPMLLHAGQAIAALEAGLAVLSEVIAASTLDECWALVEAVERTDQPYMLAENYCYMRPNMLVRQLVDQGHFGELTYAEGGYIHDCRNLMFDAGGELTWRGALRGSNGNTYPTHSLGPVAQWLGINRHDRLIETATWMSPARAARQYAIERFGSTHPHADAAHWQHGDSATTLIRTERGCLINLRFDSTSPRPHNMTHYLLQGTRGAYLSARHHGEEPLIWLAGRSPGQSPPDAAWEPLWHYAAEFEHPRWRERGELAGQSGHGGGDFFVIEDFVDAVRAGRRPPIDVYDAVSWSAIMPLSQQSLAAGGAPVAVPDFRRRPIPGAGQAAVESATA